MKFKRLARHSWVVGASITESASEDGWQRRYTATIRGFDNWKIYQGKAVNPELIMRVVIAIRDRIDYGSETVFEEANKRATDEAELLEMAIHHEAELLKMSYEDSD